jgi:hypothetical protein
MLTRIVPIRTTEGLRRNSGAKAQACQGRQDYPRKQFRLT